MHGAHRPKIRSIHVDDVLARQGEPGDALYLVLDGVLEVTVDGRRLGDLGPGAIIGERAILETSLRTATLTARTDVRVAQVRADAIDRGALAELARGHRRELADGQASS
jgi:CRP-like cAMP-binding protein